MNRKQFISYVEGTQNTLRRFLVALCCGDAALADDIAQETYIKAYLSSDGFHDESKFSAWIHRIAYNTFISVKRSQKATLNLDSAAAVPSTDKADATFKYQWLYAALKLLSEKERTAILLYYLEDYQVKEIAEVIDSSENAVKQQLSRGRNRLKNLMAGIDRQQN